VDLTAFMPLLKYVHIMGVIAFALVHGVSALVSLRVRGERNRERLRSLLELSLAYQTAGWLAMLAAVVAGVLLGIGGGWWTSGQLWLWASLLVFILVTALMTPIPTAYLNAVRHAIGMPTYDDNRRKLQPPPPASDEELAQILDSSRPFIGAVIGLAGLAVLAYLMMFKPF
jgi:hypothetical protein